MAVRARNPSTRTVQVPAYEVLLSSRRMVLLLLQGCRARTALAEFARCVVMQNGEVRNSPANPAVAGWPHRCAIPALDALSSCLEAALVPVDASHAMAQDRNDIFDLVLARSVLRPTTPFSDRHLLGWAGEFSHRLENSKLAIVQWMLARDYAMHSSVNGSKGTAQERPQDHSAFRNPRSQRGILAVRTAVAMFASTIRSDSRDHDLPWIEEDAICLHGMLSTAVGMAPALL